MVTCSVRGTSSLADDDDEHITIFVIHEILCVQLVTYVHDFTFRGIEF